MFIELSNISFVAYPGTKDIVIIVSCEAQFEHKKNKESVFHIFHPGCQPQWMMEHLKCGKFN